MDNEVEVQRTPVMEVRGVSKYMVGASGEQVLVLDGISFSVERGRTLGVVGVSGSGKSVLGQVILGLSRPSAGEVVFEGEVISNLGNQEFFRFRSRIQMVFQNPLSSINPRKTAGSILELPLKTFSHRDRRQRQDKIVELLETVGLHARHAEYYPHEFSGGQCQRLGIARALASEPDFIFLDEPVSALDVSIQAQILNLLKDLQQKFQLTYLCVANNLNMLQFMSDRLLVLDKGKVVEIGDTEEVYRCPRQQVTKDLLSAIIVLGEDRNQMR